MKKSFIIFIVGILFMSASLAAQAQGDSLSAQDKEFMKKAAMGGKMEVQLGKIASEKAASQDVKAFGQRMVRDHSKANQKLEEIAMKQNFSLPQKIDDKHRDTIEKLSGLSGEKFDAAYMETMVEDHKKDIETFKKEARQGQNPAVKEFAAETVPTLEDHLRSAKQISDGLHGKSGKKTGS